MTVEEILMWIDRGMTPNIPPHLWDAVEDAWSPEQRALWFARRKKHAEDYGKR